MAKYFRRSSPAREIREPMYLPEAAGQTFKIGDLVYLASGKITVCAHDANFGAPFGFAGANATGTTDTILPVFPIVQGDVFEGYISGTLAASMFAGNANCSFALTTDAAAGGSWIIDTATHDHHVANIIGPLDPIGTVNGRVYFVFPTPQGSVAA